MVVFGASTYQEQHVIVTSIGTGSTDGWQNVARIKGSALPDQGTEDYVFVVWTSFVGPDISAATGPVIFSRMEVALGNQNGPFQDSRLWSVINHNELQVTTAPLRSIPCFFVRGYVTGSTPSRGQWNTNDDLVLWARIFANGDPVSQVSGSSFRVGHTGILAFSLKNLGANDYLHSQYTPAQPQNNNPAGTGFRTFFLTTVFGWSQGAGDWVVWNATKFWSRGKAGAPWFQTTFSGDGSVGMQAPIFGGPPTGGSGSLLGDKNGWEARTNTGADLSGNLNRYSLGGASLLQNPATTGQFGIRGQDYGNVSGQTAALVEWEVFAIRADAAAPFGGFGDFDYVKVDFNSVPPLDRIYSDNNGSGLFEPFEPSLQSGLAKDLYWQSGWDQRADLDAWISHLHYITANVPSVSISTSAWCLVQGNQTYEGIIDHLGVKLNQLPPNAVQLQMRALQHPNEVGGGFDRIGLPDFFTFSWVWNNDVGYEPTTVPPIPGAVSIIPGREVVSVAALNTLPNGADGNLMEPEVARSDDPDIPRNEFVPTDGIKITWPKLLAPRRRFELRWSGLSAADRETLLAFFRAQEKRAFKWTPPFESEIPVVMIEPPQAIDQGQGYTVTTTVIELVWVGA